MITLHEFYPKQRNLCGIYYRIRRNDKWENVCISDMTNDEINSIFSTIDKNESNQDYYKNLSKALIETIKNIGNNLDLISK